MSTAELPELIARHAPINSPLSGGKLKFLRPIPPGDKSKGIILFRSELGPVYRFEAGDRPCPSAFSSYSDLKERIMGSVKPCLQSPDRLA